MRKMNYVFLMLIFVLIGCQPKSTDSTISNLDSIGTTQTLPVSLEEYEEYGDTLDYDYANVLPFVCIGIKFINFTKKGNG